MLDIVICNYNFDIDEILKNANLTIHEMPHLTVEKMKTIFMTLVLTIHKSLFLTIETLIVTTRTHFLIISEIQLYAKPTSKLKTKFTS